MRCIIAGSRTVTDPAVLGRALEECGWSAEITEVVSGGARGADTLGFHWGWASGVPVRSYPADWKAHGRRAGPIRNREMAEYADALIALWDGQSSGTRDMIAVARQRGLRVYVHRTDAA